MRGSAPEWVPGRPGAALAAALLLIISALAPAPAAVIVVDPEGGGDSIQRAIDAAAANDTILVRPGEYLLCRPLTFRGKAVTVLGEEGPDLTVLRRCPGPDAGGQPLVSFESGEDARSVLAGLTIAGELEDLGEFSLRPGTGGGIVCAGGASPTIRDCRIAGHSAELGGGIACIDGAAPLISRTTIAWNVALGGGGAYMMDASPVFEDCTILANMAAPADTGGSGVLCLRSSPRFSRCRFAGNAETCGSAIHVDDGLPRFESCLIYGNAGFAVEVGCADCSVPLFIHCTISGNEVDGSVCHGSVPGLFLNCIIWSRSARPLWQGDARNLLEADPLFENEGRFERGRWMMASLGGRPIRVPDRVVEEPDFRLLAGSPAIDAGVSAPPAVLPPDDFAGMPRPCRGGVDMGALERVESQEEDRNGDGIPDECQTTPLFLRGDANAGGIVDLSDALAILGFLFLGNETPGCLDAADTDDSGTINIADPIFLLGALFLGTQAIPPPHPACGPDPTGGDELGCDVGCQ